MKKIIELQKMIKYHKALYYAGTPEISDSEYDKIEDELRAIDPENEALKIVGTEVTSNDKVAHKTKMLSLNKTYNMEDLIKWMDGDEVISMFKLDGVSCSLIYENGKLQIGKTRGDGSFGENITEKIKWLNDIPQTLETKKWCEVRGELYCTEENFNILAKEMVELGLDRPTNQRNIVAGLIGRKENIFLSRHLSFMAFDIIFEEKTLNKESEKFELLINEKFETPDFQLHKDDKSIEASIKEAQEFMSNGNYQIDGLVYSINSLEKQDQLGETSHHPRYKIAYKFEGESKNTKVERIEWSVSRNGILTPVAIVNEVELSGAKITRVTLHNYGQVLNHDIKSGDEIEIIRSGEVIPKFLSKVKNGNQKLSIPVNCPVCESPVVIEDIRLYCSNKNCVGRKKEEILNFISKIGIQNLSSKRIEELIESKMLTKIEDLYNLKIEDFLKLKSVKEKSATKFHDEIQKSKNIKLATFLSALGLTGGAINKCEKITENGYDTIEKVLSLTIEKISHIEGFANKSAKDIWESLQDKKELIENLVSHGFIFEKDEKKESEISGKKICITGSLSMKRSEIEKLIKKHGGIVVGSVSKNTDILLTNDTDPASSKYKKAIQLGIKIINEKEVSKVWE